MRAALVVAAVAVSCGRLSFSDYSVAGLGSDAGGGGGGSDAMLGYCASLTPAPMFCDDFDEGKPLGSGWTRMTINDLGTMALDTTYVHSGTTSVRHAFTDHSGTMVTAARLELDLPGTTSMVTWSFDLYIDVRPTTGGGQIEIADVALHTASGDFFNDLMLNVGGASDYYHEEFEPSGGSGTFMSGDQLFPSLQSGHWYHIVMAIDLSAASYQLSIDGTAVAVGAARFAISPGTVSVHDGFDWVSNTVSGWTIHTDNVAVDAR
jgi:hypothetical protein